MALLRSGRGTEARKHLKVAVASHDWREGQVQNQDDWIVHVLRREAEALILPDFPGP
jgi:eukaryotic-like serine/threonine-protein kinase